MLFAGEAQEAVMEARILEEIDGGGDCRTNEKSAHSPKEADSALRPGAQVESARATRVKKGGKWGIVG